MKHKRTCQLIRLLVLLRPELRELLLQPKKVKR